ncbi:hypothetical protein J2756_001253 [Methanobacterium aggregans]|nr:hypothetical protein [Methanobacterium aggregans]
MRDELTELLKGKVGNSCDQEKLNRIYEKGDERQENKIPPGYKDEGHGDLVIWCQIINKAKKEEKPIIFITDDQKEDWWWRFNGKTLGPHPKLVKEFHLKTEGQLFYMYKSDRFMEYASKYLEIKVDETTIEEVRNIIMNGNLKVIKKDEDLRIYKTDSFLRNENDFREIYKHYLIFMNKLESERESKIENTWETLDSIENRLSEVKKEPDIDIKEDVLKNISVDLDILRREFREPQELFRLSRSVRSLIKDIEIGEVKGSDKELHYYKLNEMNEELTLKRREIRKITFQIRKLQDVAIDEIKNLRNDYKFNLSY